MILIPIGLIILVLALVVEAIQRLIAWAVLLTVGCFLLLVGYEYVQRAEQLLLDSWVGTLPGGVQLTGLVLGAIAVGLVVAARDVHGRMRQQAEERRWAREEAEREAENDAYWERRYGELGLDRIEAAQRAEPKALRPLRRRGSRGAGKLPTLSRFDR